jgi:hypothetical protein
MSKAAWRPPVPSPGRSYDNRRHRGPRLRRRLDTGRLIRLSNNFSGGLVKPDLPVPYSTRAPHVDSLNNRSTGRAAAELVFGDSRCSKNCARFVLIADGSHATPSLAGAESPCSRLRARLETTRRFSIWWPEMWPEPATRCPTPGCGIGDTFRPYGGGLYPASSKM